MNIDAKIWRAARGALDRAIALHIEDPGVAFIDLGFMAKPSQQSELAVRIHRRRTPDAERNLTPAAPAKIAATPDLGFAVEFIDGNFRFHLRPHTAETVPPSCQELAGGLVIANEAGRFFTLGGKVRDRQTGHAMVLSSWHVLASAWAMGENVLIYQPVAVDGGNTAEVLAEFTRNSISRGLDAAVSCPRRGKRLLNEQRGIGAVTGVALPQLGMRVVKSGAGTGVTSGIITGILGYSIQRYANRKQLIGPLVCITPENPDQKISAPGDSGAWWLESSTRRAVALHFAGSDNPNFALAFSMPEVLEALDVEIVADSPPPMVTNVSRRTARKTREAKTVEPGAKALTRPEATASVTEALTAAPLTTNASTAATLAVLDVEMRLALNQTYEAWWHALTAKAAKGISTALTILLASLTRKVIYRLAQIGLLLASGLTTIGFRDHLKRIHHGQEEKIAQLQKKLQNAKAIARVDSTRERQMCRIVSIIDRFNPEMNAELKFNLAAEIYTQSLKYRQLDVNLICATITHESGRTWNPEAISFAGALGLMQIVPSTGIMLAREEGMPWTSAEEILFNPIYNVRLGCRYLAKLVTDYGLEAGLAAYNGGAVQAKRWLKGGSANSELHPETAYYVPAILKIYREYRNLNM
jgi:hypothetical protein